MCKRQKQAHKYHVGGANKKMVVFSDLQHTTVCFVVTQKQKACNWLAKSVEKCPLEVANGHT
eukprot:NODE_1914_length_409_cov_127.262411_g1904_i0.p3 GENE.NODE_1914_length_409_cov_127.262411_g1904_i0~~NODE_1914_length_409_cov_127.262411_g1904_i0.p3  ORF type:complete len:62 (+),score=2.65 NODE_1914_length_409_cov_127.262411_g1904_i0:93-278(+)